MQINKQDLLKALEVVKPGLTNKEIIEQSDSFVFIEGIITTFNDEICLTHEVKGVNITGAIKANELYNLLGKLKKDELQVEITENEILLVSGRAKAGLTLQSEIKLPIDSLGKKGKWKQLPEMFLKGMEFAIGACTKDMSRPVLTCVHVNTSGMIEGSDGYKISNFEIGEELPVKTFLIPATSVVTVIKMKPTKIAEGEGWIHFKNEEETTLSCRIFEDDSFPDTSKFLKVKGVNITFPESLNEILDRAMVFCKKDILNASVEIRIKDGRLSVGSQSDSGWFKEDIRTSYSGELSFEITPYLLKDILSETLDCTVSNDRLKFKGDNWQYITLLKSK